MQSDFIAQISGFFGGKNRRKEVDLSTETIKIGDLIAEKFRRKSESALVYEDLSNKKKTNALKTNGINLVRIAKLDFKLNLIKRLSLNDDLPPALPARHFSVDYDDEFPPPIPERKSSLDTVIDESFQRRFSFRPIATVPLPEPLSDIKKVYPSQTPRRHAVQRPQSQPPPPPPPVNSDGSPQPPVTTFKNPLVRQNSPDDFEDDDYDDDFPNTDVTPATPSSKTVVAAKKVGMFRKSSSSKLLAKQSNDPPPPPSRPLPPPPNSKKSDPRYNSSPNLIPPEAFGPVGSPKLKKQAFHSTAKEMKLLKLKTAKSEPNLDALDHPASPPPVPARLAQPVLVLPQVPATLTQRKPTPRTLDNRPRERPKLPVKPAQNGSKSPPISSAKTAAELSKSKPGPRAAVQSSPKRSPNPGDSNRNRPLPAPPKHTEDQRKQTVRGRVGGQEVYDPREEDGDLYDVMESTNI